MFVARPRFTRVIKTSFVLHRRRGQLIVGQRAAVQCDLHFGNLLAGIGNNLHADALTHTLPLDVDGEFHMFISEITESIGQSANTFLSLLGALYKCLNIALRAAAVPCPVAFVAWTAVLVAADCVTSCPAEAVVEAVFVATFWLPLAVFVATVFVTLAVFFALWWSKPAACPF